MQRAICRNNGKECNVHRPIMRLLPQRRNGDNPSGHERQEADGCHRAPPQMRFADRT